MKKLLIFVMSLIICFSFTGCDISIFGCNHSWNSATCTNPKECKKCGEISGSARGHSTEFGKCYFCEKFINKYEKELSYIQSDIIDSIEAFNDAAKTVLYNKYSISTSVIEQSISKLNESKSFLESAIINCNKIQEFSPLRLCLEKMQKALNSISTNTQEVYFEMTYVREYAAYGKKYVEYANEAAFIISI